MYIKTLSLNDLSISLKNNTLDLAEYITATCARIEQIEPVVQALLPEPGRLQRLLSEAAVLRQQYPEAKSRPPLYGVLVGIKDLYNVDGFPTQAGSRLPAGVINGAEADIVTRLKQNGALILGKTVSTEFAYFQPGPTRNPVNPDYTPGGSSSGSAAAVAAGYCALAVGTQTIASVIRPAAYCGIIGFKPGMGRMSLAGVFPFSQSADNAGIFTQDLAGAALAASVLIDDWDNVTRALPKPCFGIPSDAYLAQADCEVFNKYQKVIDFLSRRGFELKKYPLFRDIKTINKVHRELIAVEFAHNHEKLFEDYKELYSQPSRELIEQGRQVSAPHFLADTALQITYRQIVKEAMYDQGIDLWLSPSTTTSAPMGIQSTGSPLMSLPWSFVGLPSLTIPCGKSGNDMPLGLQMVAGMGKDEYLVQYATEIYRALLYQ